jgi:cytochrome P450
MEWFNPHNSNWLKQKFEYYDKIRELDNIYFSKEYNMFVLVDYEHVLFCLKNPEIFNSGLGNLIVENPQRFGKTLGASDNPNHDIYKSIVKDSYSKTNSDTIINNVKSELLDYFKSTTINISDLSFELASLVVAYLYNFPKYSIAQIKNIVLHIQKRAEQCVKYNTSQKGYTKLLTIINELNKPELVKQSGIHKDYVSSNCPIKNSSLFTGPSISGASSLAGAIQLLIVDLYQQNKIKQLIINKSLISAAVAESLRFNASTGRFSRTLCKSVTIKNTVLPANARVAVCLDAANRDPRVFDNPNEFILNRKNISKQLAYGHGLHSCIALYLSNNILELFLETLLSTLGDYKVLNENSLEYIITNSGNNDMLDNIIISKI